MHQAVIVGAGAVGRGFLGQLFCEAGWGVTFVDVNATLVAALARDGSYPHVTVSDTGSVRTTIGPVTAIRSADEESAVAALVAADAAATAVGARELPAVVSMLATAVARRIEEGRPPLNVLLCENLHGAGGIAADLLASSLPQIDAATLDANVGLLETSIGRMIPVPDAAALALEPTVISVEPYKSLPYDAAAVRGGPLEVPGLVADPSVPFAFYVDLKLYVHNMGHVLTAYLGERGQLRTIAEAIEQPPIRHLVRAAMGESARALSLAYDRPLAGLMADVDDLIHRFGNHALGDTVERVGRDPIRKMAGGDRFLGAYACAAAQGAPRPHLSLAVAAGADALRRHEGWTDQQVRSHLERELGPGLLSADERTLLEAQIDGFTQGRDLAWQIDLIDSTDDPSRVL